MILQIVIAGACLVDGFASGLFVGHKWASAKVSSVGATIATEVIAVEAKVAPVVTTIETEAKAIEAKIAAALASQHAQATVATSAPVAVA